MAGAPHLTPDTVPRPGAMSDVGVTVDYQPILDVARGAAGGFQATARSDAAGPLGPTSHEVTTATMKAALAAFPTLPTNTFVSIPVPLALVGDPVVRRSLLEHGDLGGIVLDITDFDSTLVRAAEDALEECRRAGAIIAVGGSDTGQPELASVVRLRPAIIRLGAAWTRGIDENARRRSAIEVTGQLAGQLDAWILADEVTTAGELRTLAQLGVPLARGPFIGEAQSVWPQVGSGARRVLPSAPPVQAGALRPLLQQAFTTHQRDGARPAPPAGSGFESVVVLDDSSRPVSLLQLGPFGRWDPIEILKVNVDTSVADAAARAIARPVSTRFSPLTCTDAAGRFVGILRIERLMEHLVADSRNQAGQT